MKKIMKRIAICACFAGICWTWGLAADRQTLNEELLRLHVVADSDSAEDQAIKLRVRDAVIADISEDLANIGDFESAEAYIRENLPKIERVANETLKALGCEDIAVVTLAEEAFDTRVYDTFTLPAGVYEALRITIGSGEGKNWWCVVFPEFCVPAAGTEFEDVAAGAGFSDALTGALTGEGTYEIRFFLLDLLGKLENKFFKE